MHPRMKQSYLLNSGREEDRLILNHQYLKYLFGEVQRMTKSHSEFGAYLASIKNGKRFLQEPLSEFERDLVDQLLFFSNGLSHLELILTELLCIAGGLEPTSFISTWEKEE